MIWNSLLKLFWSLIYIWTTQFMSSFDHQPIKYLFHWWQLLSILFKKCTTQIIFSFFLIKLIRLNNLILIWFKMKLIGTKSAWAIWSLKFGIFLLIFWENNLSLPGWMVSLVLDIVFQIDDVSSPDVYHFIFFVFFRSEISFSLDQNDQSVYIFIAFIIFINPYWKLFSVLNLHKRLMPWINIFCRIVSDWSGN